MTRVLGLLHSPLRLAAVIAAVFGVVLLVINASASLSPSSPYNAGDGVFDSAHSPAIPCRNDLPTGSTDNSFTGGAKEDTVNPTVADGSIPPNKSDLTKE